jgi:hypothetical protein
VLRSSVAIDEICAVPMAATLILDKVKGIVGGK